LGAGTSFSVPVVLLCCGFFDIGSCTGFSWIWTEQSESTRNAGTDTCKTNVHTSYLPTNVAELGFCATEPESNQFTAF
jgi:hypothetical protein